MIRPKRGLMITLLVICFTLTVITVGYVMPYHAPTGRGGSRQPHPDAAPVRDSGVSAYGALMAYYRPGMVSARPMPPRRGWADGVAEAYARSRYRTFAGVREAGSHRDSSNVPVAGPARAEGVGAGNPWAEPPGLFFPPGIPSSNPDHGDEMPGLPILPPEYWFFVPGSDIPGSDIPGSDIPGSDIPGSEVPGSEVPGSEVPGSDVPGSDVPGSDVPGSDVPGSDVPGSDIPGSDLPGSDLPGSDLPEAPAPGGGGNGAGYPGGGSGGGNSHSPVPIPGSVWLLGSGLAFLAWSRGRFKR